MLAVNFLLLICQYFCIYFVAFNFCISYSPRLQWMCHFYFMFILFQKIIYGLANPVDSIATIAFSIFFKNSWNFWGSFSIFLSLLFSHFHSSQFHILSPYANPFQHTACSSPSFYGLRAYTPSSCGGSHAIYRKHAKLDRSICWV